VAADLTPDQPWTQFLSFDQDLLQVVVEYDYVPTNTTNHTEFTMFLTGTTEGKIVASKEVRYRLILPTIVSDFVPPTYVFEQEVMPSLEDFLGPQIVVVEPEPEPEVDLWVDKYEDPDTGSTIILDDTVYTEPVVNNRTEQIADPKVVALLWDSVKELGT
jgi:hypothetical protein